MDPMRSEMLEPAQRYLSDRMKKESTKRSCLGLWTSQWFGTVMASPTGLVSSEDEQLSVRCPVCAQPGRQRCSRCREVFYCGATHQTQHWPQHKPTCSPPLFKVTRMAHPVSGLEFHELVAGRKIPKGTILTRKVVAQHDSTLKIRCINDAGDGQLLDGEHLLDRYCYERLVASPSWKTLRKSRGSDGGSVIMGRRSCRLMGVDV